MATFVSFQDLITSFWEWLIILEMFALAAWELNTIRECVWNLINIGDRVFSRDRNEFGVVIDKDVNLKGIKTFWIDWQNAIEMEDPAYSQSPDSDRLGGTERAC